MGPTKSDAGAAAGVGRRSCPRATRPRSSRVTVPDPDPDEDVAAAVRMCAAHLLLLADATLRHHGFRGSGGEPDVEALADTLLADGGAMLAAVPLDAPHRAAIERLLALTSADRARRVRAALADEVCPASG